MSKLKKKGVFASKHEWLEDDLNPRETTAAGAVTSTSSRLDISNSAYVNAYDILYNTDTEEKMLVTAGTTGTHLTVSRGYCVTSAANVSSGHTLLIMGSAFEEGAAESAVLVKSTKVSNLYNYTQIFRKKVEVTGTLAASRLYGGPDRNYQRKKKGIELMRDFGNRSLILWQHRKQITSSDQWEKAEMPILSKQVIKKTVQLQRLSEEAPIYWMKRQSDLQENELAVNTLFETAFWWGSRGSSAGTTHHVRTMEGINDRVSTNSSTTVATLTETEFETHLRGPFRYGANQKYMFAAPLVISVISQWAQNSLGPPIG